MQEDLRMATDTSTKMTVERMDDFFAAWDTRDVDRVTTFFTEDGAYYASIGPDDDGTVFRGREAVRRGVAAFLETYSTRAHYTDKSVTIVGDQGFAQWTFHGTTATGREVRYRGVDVFEFVGDRIRLKDAFRKERSTPIGG
jgi:uncharacterized protein (TIGR02246 family)